MIFINIIYNQKKNSGYYTKNSELTSTKIQRWIQD